MKSESHYSYVVENSLRPAKMVDKTVKCGQFAAQFFLAFDVANRLGISDVVNWNHGLR